MAYLWLRVLDNASDFGDGFLTAVRATVVHIRRHLSRQGYSSFSTRVALVSDYVSVIMLHPHKVKTAVRPLQAVSGSLVIV